MVAMSGRSQSGSGSNYPSVKGAFMVEHLCMWKEQTNSCFAATFGCFVTIFIVTKCYAFARRRRKKKKEDNPTLKGTKMISDIFLVKVGATFAPWILQRQHKTLIR
jgi:ABC-type maltose transport system permease subunit